MRKWIGVFLIGSFVFYVLSLVGRIGLKETLISDSVGNQVITQFQSETGSANAVTSVVVLYRGFDTLGEVTVLFLAALGLSLLLGNNSQRERKIKNENFVLKSGGALLFPFIFIFGVYIILHGHLSPGGGFPGGVIIATAFFVVLLTSRVKTHEILFSILESLAGLSFIALGLVGLFGAKQSFLSNFLDLGVVGDFLSAGIIPLIYALIGIKVASELSGAVAQAFLYKEESK